jgi:ADP-ribose pyrophosphatase YjhB (NUDIX family)
VSDVDKEVIRLLERVLAISQTGLAYTEGLYDRERYVQLRELVGELLEQVQPTAPKLEVAFPTEEGYRTPKVDVRAVVLRGDEVLLVRERADGHWALPGGWGDVGLSAAENIEKEIFEESGYRAKAVRLLAVLDRDKHKHDASPWHTYKIFFLCEIHGGRAEQSLETDAAEFFALDRLPPLSIPRITEDQIQRLFVLAKDASSAPWFD